LVLYKSGRRWFPAVVADSDFMLKGNVSRDAEMGKVTFKKGGDSV
jgi:hypothetical protein